MFNESINNKQSRPMNLDVLVFAAHPDDAELAMGGTIAKFTRHDLKVGIIDFTRGELGTRGSADIRQKEAFQSAISLRVAIRENLDIPDGDIEVNKEHSQFELDKAVFECNRNNQEKIGIINTDWENKVGIYIDTINSLQSENRELQSKLYDSSRSKNDVKVDGNENRNNIKPDIDK
jgi:hypothetical protein